MSESVIRELATFAANEWDESPSPGHRGWSRSSFTLVMDTFVRLSPRWADEDTAAAISQMLVDQYGASDDAAAEYVGRIIEWLRRDFHDLAAVEMQREFLARSFAGFLRFPLPRSDEMTVSEMVKEFDLGRYGVQTVNGAIQSGRLPARKSGKFWLIKRAHAETWNQSKRRGRPAKETQPLQ